MQRTLKKSLLIIGVGILFLLAIYAQIGPLLNWPTMDESNYILQSALIAQGKLPYRDFYEFLTPLCQFIGAAFIKLEGVSVLGLRLLVLCLYLISMVLVYEMSKSRLGRFSQILLLGFLWFTLAHYPVFQHHTWSGFLALVAVFFAWKDLKQVYAGRKKTLYLILSGMFTALCFWATQSLGVLIFFALLGFGLLHSWLQHREAHQILEEGTQGTPLKKLKWLKTWCNHWVRLWLSSCLLMHCLWIGTFAYLGILPAFWRDSVLWLTQGHYGQTTTFGYFVTFKSEFIEILRPFIDGLAYPFILFFTFRWFIACQLLLIGILPLIAILQTGSVLPGRLRYRILRLEDEENALFWLSSLALIGSTFSYSRSLLIVSNGAIPFMLGWFMLWECLEHWVNWQKIFNVGMSLILLGIISGEVLASGLLTEGTPTLPKFKGLAEPLRFYTDGVSAQQFLNVVNKLEEAKRDHRSIFVFNALPSLYLPGIYKNATRFTLVIPFYISPLQLKEIIADLNRNHPMFIVDDNMHKFYPKDPRFEAFAKDPKLKPLFHIKEIENYIRTHCRFETQQGRLTLYRCR
jgi:hypothetical protein